jgi:hypothetical protein
MSERSKKMTVKELAEKLSEYNQTAEVKIVAHNTMSDFDITFGTSEGCEKDTCDTVFLDLKTIADNATALLSDIAKAEEGR